VVARDKLELLAEHAARRIDLLDAELETLAIGLQERRLGLVAVELADPKGLLGRSRIEGDCEERAGQRCEGNASDLHDPLRCSDWLIRPRHRIGTSVSPRRSINRIIFAVQRLVKRGYVPIGASKLWVHRSRMRSISGFCWPPSISIMVPLAKCISGEASIATRFATSSTSAMRPIGIDAGASLSASSQESFMSRDIALTSPAQRSVRTGPGLTAHRLMLCLPYWPASDIVRFCPAALAAPGAISQ